MTHRAGARAAEDAEIAAYLLLEQLRWAGSPTCPHCGDTGRARVLVPADGRGRATRTGHRSVRRVWRCPACRRQFSVLTGTVLHGTRAPVHTWIAAAAILTASPDQWREPDAAAHLVQSCGVDVETARHVLARMRAAAQAATEKGRQRQG